MDPAPAAARPRGRPTKASNAIWELDINRMEMREMFETVGPVLRRLDHCPSHRRETSLLAGQIARMYTRSQHRTA